MEEKINYWPNMINDWIEITDTEIPENVRNLLLKLEEAVHNRSLSGMLLQEGHIAELLCWIIEQDMEECEEDDFHTAEQEPRK